MSFVSLPELSLTSKQNQVPVPQLLAPPIGQMVCAKNVGLMSVNHLNGAIKAERNGHKNGKGIFCVYKCFVLNKLEKNENENEDEKGNLSFTTNAWHE